MSVWGALLSSSGTAFADTTVDLPDDSLTQTLPDGTAVTLSVRDQYAIISPAMVAVQTSRNMWANGTVRVDIEGKVDEGRITPGYIIGCQFDFGRIDKDNNVHGGASAGGQFNGGASSPGTDLNASVALNAGAAAANGAQQVGNGLSGALGGLASSPPNAAAIGQGLRGAGQGVVNGISGVGSAIAPAATPYLPGGAIGFSLEPGQTFDFPMLKIEEPDDYGNQAFDNYFAFSGNRGGITYTDVTFRVDGCAGYAQARAYTKVRVKNSKTMAWVTLWGPPFSIG
ncbi:MAG: MspA family porin [Segniliparus sp.]|uniref:MspA family porin n=1 Tax=Segniliparus sp. TaxID=2804064 RepID=UPI003F374843